MSTESQLMSQFSSPDENAAGLVPINPDPLRYDGKALDPDEVSGIVASMVPKGARVLDIGCATGSLAQILDEVCQAHIVGIEPDPTRARVAQERGMEVFVGYLTQELIRKIGVFDVVLLTDVLEHLPNPYAMILLSREALKPHGAVIVSVPNVAHWSVRSYLLRGKFQYQLCGIMDATHLRWFTASSIKAFITSSGFKVIKYRATAGVGLFDNDNRAPLAWLPPNFRASFLRIACKQWPTLFGAQHVLKAEKI